VAGDQPLKLRGPQPRPCPGAVELADKPGDFRMCQDVTEEFLCPKHWSRVSSETRRAFNAERDRQREERQYAPSPLMRKLIEAAITESAIRLKPDDPPPVVEVAPHPFSVRADPTTGKVNTKACAECGRTLEDVVHSQVEP
jgi:hypothetical protein